MTIKAKLMTPKTIVQLVLVLVVIPLLPVIVSGAWGWWETWAYALLAFFGFVISRVLAARRHPDLLLERSRSMGMKDAKPWDRILSPLMALGSIVPLVIAGLDKLFNWTAPFGFNIKIVSLVVIALGYVLGSWALIENRFFSGVVRIQADRGHHVVATGPYRFIRHPGYASAFWTYLATPLLLDSLWAFIPTFLLIGILILRTTLEDRTLQVELTGYADYARRTRFRLFPRIW